MSMDLGHTGVKFDNTTQNPKYIRFNSEVAIRKGVEGWVINSRVDNWTNDSIEFNYILTSYTYKSNSWTKEGESKLWKDPSAQPSNPIPLSKVDPNGNGNTYMKESINMNNKKLIIKTPQSSWWESAEWISPSANARTKNKNFLNTKQWSGAWIHNENKDSWIFKDIELYVGDRKYSQVFCEDANNCRQKSNEDMNERTHNTNNLETWQEAEKQKQKNESEKVQQMVTSTIPLIIDKIKDLKGEWVDMEKICSLKEAGEPNEEKQNQLRIYCSNGKTPGQS